MFRAQEEEDLQQWMEGVPGPWSDQGWTSHVLIAVGGELEAWRQIFGWNPLVKKMISWETLWVCLKMLG